MVTTLSLTLTAIAKGMSQSRGRRDRSVVGVECLRGRRRRVVVKREFLEDQVVSDLVEGREQCAARDDGSKMILSLV
jgi:hypothetical protein